VQGPSDAELIDAVRKGTLSAYGELYERHVASAYNLARQLTRSQAEMDDLVSEAFAKVMETLKAGRGPDSAFRAYLLTALRHTAYDKTRRDKRIELSDDVGEVSGINPEQISQPFSDPAVAGLERSLAARAFARLPERWQAVLWHTEIEGQSPAEVAPILGLTPNGVSALAYRAREGLKQAYLQVYLAETAAESCRATTDRLGAWTRDGLSKREKAQVEAHLDGCAKCRALAAELADVNSALRLHIAPLVLGSGTLGYLAVAGTATGGAIAGGAVAAGAAAGAAGAAGSAGGSGGGGAAAGASVPRQFIGVGAATAALAAAIVVGLTSGGGQQIPNAQPQPQVQQPTRTPNSPAPPTAAPPAPTTQPPTPPATTTPPAAPTSPASPPAPGAPSLSASPPAVPISLIAGGDAVDLPILVQNTGGSVSEPVSATLALPAGVTAIPSGAVRLGAPPLLRLDAPAPTRLAAGTVFCPGGTRSVTCGTGQGLAPGDSVTLLFRLIASADSQGGEVTGTVTGGSVSVRVTVRVVVRPPAPVDGVDVKASADSFDILLPGLFGRRLVNVVATNTGTSTKPVTVTIDQAAARLTANPPMTCTSGHHTTSCTTTAAVPPGGVVKLSVKLTSGLLGLRCPSGGSVTITATLGSATDTTTVVADCWSLPVLPGLLPGHPEQGPPRPPTKPHLESPNGPPAPAIPVPPPSPSPLPNVQPPVAPPPPGKPILPPVLNWLLPL
jgi:RNA polymerase sigma factor (sigma-70 family)